MRGSKIFIILDFAPKHLMDVNFYVKSSKILYLPLFIFIWLFIIILWMSTKNMRLASESVSLAGITLSPIMES